MPTRSANEYYSVEEAELELRFGTGGTFTDYSTYATTVEASDGGRDSETFPDLSGGRDTVLGALNNATVTFTLIITKAVDAPYYLSRKQLEDKLLDAVDITYRAKGATTGDIEFVSTGGQITACPPASFNAGSTGRAEVQVTLVCPTLAQAIIA